MSFINLKQSFRNIYRNKIYSFVNLTGLGVATSFILLVAVYIQHSLQVDTYNEKTGRIYRIESAQFWQKPDTTKKAGFFDLFIKDAEKQYQLVTPLVLAAELKKNLAEVEDACRMKTSWEPVIQVNQTKFKEEGKDVVFVDRNFFSFFDLPLLTGNANSALQAHNAVVLTETAAKKYFGTTDAVGKVITLSDNGDALFTVSAIAKDFPYTSSMQFSVLLPLEGIGNYKEMMEQGTNTSSVLTLLSLRPGVNENVFRKKLYAFGENYFSSWVASFKKYMTEAKDSKVNLSIRSFREGHYNVSSPWFAFTDVKSLYQLFFLALVALAIAALNYVLLSLSRVASRSGEAGIRKTVGAGWKQMVKMFMTETLVVVLCAVTIGYVLAIIALPFFNELSKAALEVKEILQLRFIVITIGVALLLTFISGIYPAIKMAGIKPLSVLNKFGTYKLNPSLSKVFLTLQYTACIVLIVFSIVIARQVHYMNNRDLGFEKEQTLIIKNPYWGNREKTMTLRDRLRQYAASQPAIAGFTGSTFRYGNGFNMNGHRINDKQEMITEMTVDYDYFETNKIPVIKGRAFSREYKSDTSKMQVAASLLDTLGSQKKAMLVVNETLYKLLGQPPLNEWNKPLGAQIVGVCKDYFYQSMQQVIGPAYHICRPDRVGYFWLKIKKVASLQPMVEGVKGQFISATNGETFNYSFMDEDLKAVYEAHQRWLQIISIASWMAIFIACLGLFGFSAIIAVNRTKEISIRKILGASIAQLFYTLNRQTGMMVLLSIIIAVPIAIYISGNWLQNFAYRIHLSWTYFLMGAFIAIICALLAISFNTLKVATSKAANNLRGE